jgi:hypothetical protein
MDRKYIGAIFIVLGLIILALIIYFIFFFDFSPKTTQTPAETNIQNTLPAVNNNPVANVPAKKITIVKTSVKFSQQELKEMDLKNLAGSFTERFGTYSNQSPMTNVTDLKVFMSQKMQAWADDFVAQESRKSSSDIYYGITTKAVVEEVKSYNDNEGQAQIVVKTQRREATGSSNNVSYLQQDIIVNFVKENGAWKVDSAYWQENS